ncbi:MAG: 5-formyltetrahydrofolate cyclo-ligase [Gemmatimonadota bacterium]
MRARLLAKRMDMEDRAERERVLVNRVSRWLHTMPVKRLAFFWPIRGEPSLAQLITAWLAEDSTRQAALPIVVGELLEFAPWTPSTPMEPGAYGIQVPASKLRMKPQVLLIPCLGIDENRYRLGYGGGFYDRTLARISPRPVAVGIAFDCARLPSIKPQPHDIRLDLALTESGAL